MGSQQPARLAEEQNLAEEQLVTERTSEIHVRTLGGAGITLLVNPSDDVHFLKQAAAAELGAPATQVKLVHASEVLGPERKVCDLIGQEVIAIVSSEKVAWSHEEEITHFPRCVGSLEDLGMIDSSFTLMASVWRAPSAPDAGGQYVSDQAIFAMNEFSNAGNLTNLHFLVRDGHYAFATYRSNSNFMNGPAAAKGQWEDVALVMDKDAGKTVLYINGKEVASVDNEPLDQNPGNKNKLWLGQYAFGRHWKGKMKNVKVLNNAWSP